MGLRDHSGETRGVGSVQRLLASARSCCDEQRRSAASGAILPEPTIGAGSRQPTV